jgi:hypothetical protein
MNCTKWVQVPKLSSLWIPVIEYKYPIEYTWLDHNSSNCQIGLNHTRPRIPIGYTWLDHNSPNYPNRVYLAGLILDPESQIGYTYDSPNYQIGYTWLDSESQLGILGCTIIRLTTKLGDLWIQLSEYKYPNGYTCDMVVDPWLTYYLVYLVLLVVPYFFRNLCL